MASGFNFGGGLGGSTGTPGAGFSFGAQKTTASALAVPSLTPAATTVSSLSFSMAPKTTAAATGLGGFSFGIPAKTTASAGFGMGAGLGVGTAAGTPSTGVAAVTTTTASTGFSFGLNPATSSTASTGLTLGGTTSTAAGGLGGFSFGGTTSSAPLLGLGGQSGTTTTAAGSIFSKTTTAPTVTGLGGLDPKTSTAGTGVGGLGSVGDGKALKESNIPAELVVTADDMQQYVKGEKAIREDIVRMSSKPIVRVQEDIAALKQLLSVVSNGLQRNACTLDKLKAEMTQELKNAEMAQRTKDIPPGLQYENTAPNEYFEQLVDQFEARMVSYRQQIETLESHLSVLHQPIRHSPAEIFTLIKRLHENFIALAAQLQQVHENIKAQKEQFLTFRRVFHGDTKDIFQPSVLASSNPVVRRPADTSGPTPFPGITNAAAAAMASVLNRPQQPHGPPVAGLLGTTGTATSWLSGAGSGLGAPGGLLGGTAGTGSLLGQTGTVGGQGLGVSSMFSLGTAPSGAAATSSNNNNSLASTLGSLNNTANQSLNVSAATKQPFTLQKPPPGAKRGKR